MGDFIGYQFGRGGAWDLPITVLVSGLLHIILFLALSHSAFMVISGSSQPSFVAIDLMPAPAAEPGDNHPSPPPPVEKSVQKPEPEQVHKRIERVEKPLPPPPARDEIPLKKTASKTLPQMTPKEAPKDEAKPAPSRETAKPLPEKASPAAPSASSSDAATTPISALEGAREGIDVNSNYYIRNMVAQITRRWLPPANLRYAREKSPVTVYFKVQKDGSITDVAIETSSGRQDLDLSAKRAVIETNAIPPLPANLIKDDSLGVHFKFIPKGDEKG